MPSAGATPAAAADSSMRCAIRRPIGSSRPMSSGQRSPARRRPAAARDDRACAAPPVVESTARRGFDSNSTAATMRGSRATRWRRRCSQTACTWSAGRSSITGRAASSLPDPRNRTAWSRWSATGRARRRTCALTQIELYEGLQAFSQNRWPSLQLDVGRVNDLLSRFFPAGFYYKTFMWPKRAWKALYEPVIRRAAGLGEAPSLPDPDRYSQRYAHCDVLVVGAGPAGIAAATAAAATGARVMLCDEQNELGGSLLSESAALDRGGARARVAAPIARGARRQPARRAAVSHDRLRLLPAQFDRAQRASHRSSCSACAGCGA